MLNEIGVGNTATIYAWEEGKVLKLFYKGYPRDAVEKEFNNAIVIRDMNFKKPSAYEIVTFEERAGIIYDKIEGESLLDWVMRTGDAEKCAAYMANLHKTLLQNSVSNVPNYKDVLRTHIPNTLSVDKQKDIMQMIDTLADGNTLCHGDFHPGNILISNENTTVIDFMNVCYGDFLYDVARTVFLIEYTPVPLDLKDRDDILVFKKTLCDLYLMKMNVTREMIKDYLTIIIIVRKGECPNE